MCNLFWVLNFIKISHIRISRPNLSKFLFRVKIRNFKYHICDSQTWPALIAKFHSIGNMFHFFCISYISFLLMLNVWYLALILTFLVLTWWFCSLPGGYWWLLLVTWWSLLVIGGYFSLPTFSMNELRPQSHWDLSINLTILWRNQRNIAMIDIAWRWFLEKQFGMKCKMIHSPYDVLLKVFSFFVFLSSSIISPSLHL